MLEFLFQSDETPDDRHEALTRARLVVDTIRRHGQTPSHLRRAVRDLADALTALQQDDEERHWPPEYTRSSANPQAPRLR